MFPYDLLVGQNMKEVRTDILSRGFVWPGNATNGGAVPFDNRVPAVMKISLKQLFMLDCRKTF